MTLISKARKRKQERNEILDIIKFLYDHGKGATEIADFLCMSRESITRIISIEDLSPPTCEDLYIIYEGEL